MTAALKLPADALDTAPPVSTWPAFLHLHFARRARGVRLVQSQHEGPLYVQKAFYPEGPDCAHCYLLHPPGGLVSGDSLAIDVMAQPHTHVLLTTPGAGRVYKAREHGAMQRQSVHLRVQADAVLEWLPLETLLFPRARASLDTRIELAENARVIAWDITCFGLPANGEPFTGGRVCQSLQVWSQGRLRLNERLVLESDDTAPSVLAASAGFRQRPVHGLLIAGPFGSQDDGIDALLTALRQLQGPVPHKEATLVGVTRNGAFISVRCLGWCTESVRHTLIRAWHDIRPILTGRAGVAPRIWAT